MQTQTLYDALKDRRSINLRDLLPDPIALTCLEQMLEAANWAPSHGHTEPWRFTVFAGEARHKLGEVFAEAYRLGTPAERFDEAIMAFTRDRVLLAPVWISIGLQPDAVKKMPEWEEISAVAIAVHNLHLMTCGLGLGCKWSSGAASRHPHVAQFLGLQPPAQLLGFLYVGKPAKAWPPGQRRPMADKVTWMVD
ncbi:MAG TPA: nitroreductase [Candidatus Saccharimonadia bacterium]|nr:nitroreductase [Candidatus Saccharimonadia bacterium]